MLDRRGSSVYADTGKCLYTGILMYQLIRLQGCNILCYGLFRTSRNIFCADASTDSESKANLYSEVGKGLC